MTRNSHLRALAEKAAQELTAALAAENLQHTPDTQLIECALKAVATKEDGADWAYCSWLCDYYMNLTADALAGEMLTRDHNKLRAILA